MTETNGFPFEFKCYVGTFIVRLGPIPIATQLKLISLIKWANAIKEVISGGFIAQSMASMTMTKLMGLIFDRSFFIKSD